MVACNTAGQYGEAVRVHKVMTAAGTEANGATFSAALTAYARSGQLETALQLFTSMGARGFERGTNTYAAVLFACELPGRYTLTKALDTQQRRQQLLSSK
jgi:pentatricopeptide repeat protein